MARPVPAEHLPADAVCALTADGRLGPREQQAIEWFADFLAAHKAATTDAERAAALAECNARFAGEVDDDQATAAEPYIPEPYDPGDYCGTCHVPRSRHGEDCRMSDLL
jgi:hypothetical protein